MTEKHLKRYIGVRLKELRQHAGLKQEDVGKVVGLSRVSILNMESGRHSPTPFKLLSMCRLFNCTLNDIFPPVDAIKYTIEEKTITVKKKVKQFKIIK
jgi:DNA-binding XRE family transcriptional regulator